jgi:predicted alpha/beta hydrolase
VIRLIDRFARFLAEQGFDVLCYDYRGIGDSLDGDIRRQSARMLEWGECDTVAAIDHAAALFPKHRLLLIGHSAGGQLLGLAKNNGKVAAMLAVSAQSGYWMLWPFPQRLVLGALWYGIMPGLTSICSYFPGKRLGFGENLPAGAAREWAAWCRHPDYMVDGQGKPMREHFNQFNGPIRAYVISDDWMAPRAAVQALMGFYRAATVELLELTPADNKGKALGQFGFFPVGCMAAWQDSSAWLAAQ